jgi:hypothetical protein
MRSYKLRIAAVSSEKLKNAVKQVGSVAKDVEAYLNKEKK